MSETAAAQQDFIMESSISTTAIGDEQCVSKGALLPAKHHDDLDFIASAANDDCLPTQNDYYENITSTTVPCQALTTDDDNDTETATLPQHVQDAWKWFRSHGSPRYWVAPLVGLSDKSFRILCRHHGAHMCHTEMTDPGGFVRSEYYRSQALGIEMEGEGNVDRPLVLQLGSSNIPKLLEAIRIAVSLQRVDAVELNCGCPQMCARKGNYGSFLLDPPHQNTLLHIIETIHNSDVMPRDMPLLVKMRVLECIDETVDLAKRIVEAGAGILTVHGRTRHQGGGSKTSGRDQERLASWPHIRAVKEAVQVPVIANGNVPNRLALPKILAETGCDGVMSGVGILRDPTIFDGSRIEHHDDDEESWYTAVQTAMEYLALAATYHTHPIRVSKHLLWMLDGKGFKNRAPLAREQTLKLKCVRNSELKSNYTHHLPIPHSRPRIDRQLSISWLGRCLSISILLFVHHCSTFGVKAYTTKYQKPNGRRQRETAPIESKIDFTDTFVSDKFVSRQHVLDTFQSIVMASVLSSASIPDSAFAKETVVAPQTESVQKTSPDRDIPPPLIAALLTTASTAISSSTSLQESISGSVAGAALTTTKTLVKFPLDTATVRLQQVNATATQNENLLDLFRDCYNGVTVTLLCNIPAGAIFFAVKDGIKSALKQSGLLLPRWATTCLAVAVAQIPYWLVRNPSEVIKVRQQANVYDEKSSKSAFGIIKETLQEQGVRDLYTGYWENILYAFPADVLKFVVYEMITGGSKDLSPLQGAEAGALATALAQLVTTPLDVVRNRLMMKVPKEDVDSSSSSSYWDSLVRLGREEGLEGLFAGAAPRVGKAILSGAIQFATYEETKQSIMKLLSGQG